VLGHELELAADRIVEVDGDLIPTGRLPEVAGKAHDFREAKPVGRDLEAVGGGYDVSYVLAGFDEIGAAGADMPMELRHAATLRDPASGRHMTLATTEPCVQLYTGQYLEGRPGKRGAVYPAWSGLCLEAQHPPDALHQPGFPSVVCRPGAPYRQVTELAFGVG
jgi:aldose 1-epimerase